MKSAFSKVIHLLTSLWRTVVRTFVRQHIYTRDVDSDGVDELVLDINGNKVENSSEDTVKRKEE